ncbi:Co2+/Mg2+ efflux protein ApaG [Nitrincola tapanii]|uniref:Protein ApaG n=1 Tax=Nitrincola tapanii TaxID=1708751 RepID=A0A5A9W1E2_9GAMM|nr:Co2+/Mg2+ efflux protein ApaG [Nitrincola tapanii]KAA0874029.1 Co2+/Mg2+ efflux protein ApaG [Nitrincola tapanii]
MTAHNLAEQIDINIKTAYLPEQSDPDAHRFVFSYQITITNHAPVTVQLLSRRWLITDGNEQTQEVQGEGVVGEQPIIEPGRSYSYTSGTVLPTRVGSMQGHYKMHCLENHEGFLAPIPAFTLAQPNALH